METLKLELKLAARVEKSQRVRLLVREMASVCSVRNDQAPDSLDHLTRIA